MKSLCTARSNTALHSLSRLGNTMWAVSLLGGNPLPSDRLVPDHSIDERLASLPCQDMLDDEPPVRPVLRRPRRCPQTPRRKVGALLLVTPNLRWLQLGRLPGAPGRAYSHNCVCPLKTPGLKIPSGSMRYPANPRHRPCTWERMRSAYLG